MQCRFDYPQYRKIEDKRLSNEVFSSLHIQQMDKNITKCNIKVVIYKKLNKRTGLPFKRQYYTYSELEHIIAKILSKYCDLDVQKWEFIEKTTNNNPQIEVVLFTIGELQCQYQLLKKKLKNIMSQMKQLNPNGKKPNNKQLKKENPRIGHIL